MSEVKEVTRATIEENIGLHKAGLSFMRKYYIIIGLVLISLGVWFYIAFANKTKPISYVTESIKQDELIVKISATGNLEPTTQVDVGSELSGTIQEVLVNDNDYVKKEQILARLDTSKLEDQVFKSQASVKSAKASISYNEAIVKEARSNLVRLQEAWKLSKGKIPSKSEMAIAEAALDKAVANKQSAEASVAQAEATLRSDQTNLSKALIRSPIDGIVLLRDVEPGQTVAASLQSPILFVLAQSLAQMELQVDIDEADVGQVKEGQDAEFTVDAYPDRIYPAKIKRVRFGSETMNGVVTYQGVLHVENDDLTLRPGMTATANIITLKKENTVLVPNAALRFVPNLNSQTEKKSAGILSALIPRPPSEDKAKTVKIVAKGANQTVWVLENGVPKPVPIVVGASDGRNTQFVSGELKAGDEVITDSTQGE